MSLSSWPETCPECGSTDFVELARIEAAEFGPDDPPTDRAIYSCRDCHHEWEQ
jgi:hypothetical protein